jgi:hypothetical protein
MIHADSCLVVGNPVPFGQEDVDRSTCVCVHEPKPDMLLVGYLCIFERPDPCHPNGIYCYKQLVIVPLREGQ